MREVGAVGVALAGEPWFASMRPGSGPRAAHLEGVLDALSDGTAPA
ncbi:MAG: hypothetical protein M0004_17555 [Actinomycetota bacterium]|nr:hypothetical protein [Actinomycetota bacterium]